MRTLNWTWKKDDTDIRIFDGEKLIGRIPSFYDSPPTTISKKSFFIDCPKKMYRTFISDPKDNKAYCEIDLTEYPRCRLFCPAFEFSGESIGFWPFKKKWFLSNKGIRMAELEVPGGFFGDKGVLNIFQEDNYEIAIFSLFYFNSLTEPAT